MNGLQTYVRVQVNNRTFRQTANGTAWNENIGNPYYTEVMSPSWLQTAANGMASTNSFTLTKDTKMYLRQDRTSGIITNHTNVPIMIQMTYYKYRKAIAASDKNLIDILSYDAPSVGSSWIPLTLGSTAQRLLKFGRSKIVKLQPNGTKKYKLSAKFYSPKLITTDVEANGSYTSSKYTKGILFKVIPTVQLGLTSPNVYFQAGPGAFTISFMETYYTTLYFNGIENPQVNASGILLPGAANSKTNIWTDDTSATASGAG